MQVQTELWISQTLLVVSYIGSCCWRWSDAFRSHSGSLFKCQQVTGSLLCSQWMWAASLVTDYSTSWFHSRLKSKGRFLCLGGCHRGSGFNHFLLWSMIYAYYSLAEHYYVVLLCHSSSFFFFLLRGPGDAVARVSHSFMVNLHTLLSRFAIVASQSLHQNLNIIAIASKPFDHTQTITTNRRQAARWPLDVIMWEIFTHAILHPYQIIYPKEHQARTLWEVLRWRTSIGDLWQVDCHQTLMIHAVGR